MPDLKGVVAKARERRRSIILMILFSPLENEDAGMHCLPDLVPEGTVQLFFTDFSPLTEALGRLK